MASGLKGHCLLFPSEPGQRPSRASQDDGQVHELWATFVCVHLAALQHFPRIPNIFVNKCKLNSVVKCHSGLFFFEAPSCTAEGLPAHCATTPFAV
jgi:hypothetical protein